MSAELIGFESVASFSESYRQARISAVDALARCRAAIDASDASRPLNAIIALNPSALNEATALDRAFRAGRMCGKMHGVPIVVKDNIDVTGMPTTAGSIALRAARPRADAAVIAALRAAGAVIVGKANMSEFGMSNGRPGYSSTGGVVRHPDNPDFHASGSSSGSAVAVAAGLALAALGTDSFGSVRAPTSVTGCIGLRPTWGLLSLDGILPLAPSFDTVGPITRCVEDLPILMTALAPGKASYRDFLDRGALSRARLGILRFAGIDSEVESRFETAIDALAKVGCAVEVVPKFTTADALLETILSPIADIEFAPALSAYLDRTPGAPASVMALITELERQAERNPAGATSAETLAKLRLLLAVAPLPHAADLDTARAKAAALRHEIGRYFAEGIDALFLPTHLGLPENALDALAPLPSPKSYNPMEASYLASALGFPEITVPAGRSRAGLPIGMSFLGPPQSEQRLMDLAAGFRSQINF